MSDRVMQIMGPTANTGGGLLSVVRDADGCYRAPLRPDGKCISSDLSEKSGDVVVAVLDSGFVLEHPVLAQFTEQSIDFTGEGVGDQNGHGTVVALQLCAKCDFRPRLWNLKVVGADGTGRPSAVIDALSWLARTKEGPPKKRLIVNLSLGTYSRRYGFLDCDGTCAICKAAVDFCAVTEWAIVAAAGNVPRRTACPAKAGLLRKSELIVSVGAPGLGIGRFMRFGVLPPFERV